MQSKVTEYTAKQAIKFDDGKVQDLFPVRALALTNQAFTYGAIKYDVGNWHSGSGFDHQRLLDGLSRHVTDHKLGITFDPESGIPVLAHLICCASMLLESLAAGIGSDTRAHANIVFQKDPEGSWGFPKTPEEEALFYTRMPKHALEVARKFRSERLAKAEQAPKTPAQVVSNIPAPPPGAVHLDDSLTFEVENRILRFPIDSVEFRILAQGENTYGWQWRPKGRLWVAGQTVPYDWWDANITEVVWIDKSPYASGAPIVHDSSQWTGRQVEEGK